MSLVLWIDDENWRMERQVLEKMGLDVHWLKNAAMYSLWEQRHGLDDVSFVLLDVMLTQGENTIYSDNATQRGQTTGLIVAKQILDRKNNYRDRLHLFSKTGDPVIIAEIKKFRESCGCSYTQKSPNIRGLMFRQWFLAISKQASTIAM